VSCAKSAEPFDLPFGLWTRGAKESQVQSYSPVGANVPDDTLRELCKNS